MTPREYYEKRFRTDFATFWRSLAARGSVSRARGSLLRQGHDTMAPQSESGFSVYDLARIPRRPDHLRDVDPEDLPLFLFSVFYTVLVDQVMYCHFREDYAAFRVLTMYPKMDATAEWAGWLSNADPLSVFSPDVVESRRLDKHIMLDDFVPFVEFMVEDLNAFFAVHPFSRATWLAVRDAILGDQDCGLGEFGAVFLRVLRSSN